MPLARLADGADGVGAGAGSADAAVCATASDAAAVKTAQPKRRPLTDTATVPTGKNLATENMQATQ